MIKKIALATCALVFVGCGEQPKPLVGEAAENVLAMCIMQTTDIVSLDNLTKQSLINASRACEKVAQIDTRGLGEDAKKCLETFVHSAPLLNDASQYVETDVAQAYEIISEISENECLSLT